MTNSDGECFPDPRFMDDEQKLELIEALHSANHTLIDDRAAMAGDIANLGYAMLKWSEACDFALAKGHKRRKKTLALLGRKMEVIGTVALNSVGVSNEQVEEHEAFHAIIDGLEGDPDFNPEEGLTEEG